MAGNITMELRNNRLPKLIAGMEPKAKNAVRHTAHAIRDNAFQLAAVDTGAMRTSIYVAMDDENGYERAVQGAKNRRSEATFASKRFISKPLEAEIVVPIHYGVHQEFGTARHPGKPFLGPASVNQRKQFPQRMKSVGKP